MGASNAMAAYLQWRHLPDRAFRALVFMALVSMDADDPPRYFGGREALIERGLGRQMVPEPAPNDTSVRAEEYRKARTADFQACKVVISQLVKAGAIECDVRATSRRQAEYRLILNRSMRYVSPTDSGTSDVPARYVSPTDSGTSDVPARYVSPTDSGTSDVPPRRDPPTGGPQGGTTRNTGGTTSPEVGTSPGADADYTAASKFLQQFDDLGGSFLEKTPEEMTLRERVILAADMARAASA